MPAQYYYTFYLCIVSLLTLWLSSRYSVYGNNRLHWRGEERPLGALALTAFMVLFIGLRPLSGKFVDMVNYHTWYVHMLGTPFEFDWSSENFLFDNLHAFFYGYSVSEDLFFLTIAAIYFGCLYIACRKLFPRDTLYAIVVYLAAFSTFSYGTNGIKAGAAASIFLCAMAYHERLPVCAALLFVSLGFHHSMILPIAAFVAARLYRNPQAYLWVWIGSLLVAALHITYFQGLFGSMADESGAKYLSTEADDGFRAGFRPDFIAYSATPVLLGYYLIFKRHYRSATYELLYCLYLLANAVWMLCMYASFTNRIAYLSWFMLPVVLVYPFFDKGFDARQYKFLNQVAWAHLGFTLFMQIIYYS